MTKLEKQQELKNIEKARQEGYAAGMKAKSLSMAASVEQLFKNKAWVK